MGKRRAVSTTSARRTAPPPPPYSPSKLKFIDEYEGGENERGAKGPGRGGKGKGEVSMKHLARKRLLLERLRTRATIDIRQSHLLIAIKGDASALGGPEVHRGATA